MSSNQVWNIVSAVDRTQDSLYAAGHYFLDRERFSDAAAFFRMLLVGAPGDERGWLGLGYCHESLNEKDLAMEIYGAGAQIAERKSRCLLACARLCSEDDDVERQRDILAAAKQEANDDEEAMLVEYELERIGT